MLDNKELIEKIDGEEAQAVEAVPATPTVKKRRRKTLKEQLHFSNFLMLTVAGIINAFGVTVFLSPVKLYDSGISGTSMLLEQITPAWLSLSVFLILLNEFVTTRP